MGPQVADIFEAAVYSVGAIGVTWVFAKHWYLRRKSDNETYPARMQAIKELMESPGYGDYLEKRIELTKRICSDSDYKVSTDSVDSVVITALGSFSPGNLR